MSKRIIFKPTYSSSGFQVAGAFLCSSGREVGLPLGQVTFPSQGTLTPTPTFTQIETIKAHQFTYCAHLGTWEETHIHL